MLDILTLLLTKLLVMFADATDNSNSCALIGQYVRLFDIVPLHSDHSGSAAYQVLEASRSWDVRA